MTESGAPTAVVPPIAVVQGAASAEVQRLLGAFVARRRGQVRMAGLIEDAPEGCDGCAPAQLVSIADGASYPIFQDLGPGSTACSLDSEALVRAGEAICRDIARGVDLVVLSKFAKAEAESRSGLLPAFMDAIAAGVPIVTAVAPRFMPRWAEFAAPLYEVLPADGAALEAWWARRDAQAQV